jgi:phage-related minor tail protein
MSEEKKTNSNDAPDMQEIGDKLKELGRLIQQAIEKAHKSEEVKKINEDVANAYADVKKQVKSGEFADNAKREVKNALTFVNQKLDEYLKDEEPK